MTKEIHGNDAVYDDTQLQSKVTALESSVGDISSVLDIINGEVI